MGDANLTQKHCLQKKREGNCTKIWKEQRSPFSPLRKFCFFRAPSNLLTACTLTQQKGHKVVLEKNNLHVSTLIIMVSSRDCPRSVDDTDHKRK